MRQSGLAEKNHADRGPAQISSEDPGRLKSVVKIQEGDEPDEDADNHFLRNRYFCY